jgi:FkbM family methyltransferase
MAVYELLVRALEAVSRRARVVNLKTHSVYARPLGRDSVVVDLGANVGDFATAAADRFGCVCYAVEAVPAVFDQIPAHDRIRKYNLAVAEADGPVRLFTSANRECHSVHEAIATAYTADATVETPGVRLDRFLNDRGIGFVDLLKVDIEGSE